MKVGFWIWDFHVFETEVQMIMDLIGKRRKMSVAISAGNDSHRIELLLSDIAAEFREREREMTRGKEGCEALRLSSVNV